MVRGDGDVPGLEDLNFFDKLDYQIDETATKIQGIDVEDGVVAPRPRNSRPNLKRSKIFDPKEDLVVASAWLM